MSRANRAYCGHVGHAGRCRSGHVPQAHDRGDGGPAMFAVTHQESLGRGSRYESFDSTCPHSKPTEGRRGSPPSQAQGRSASSPQAGLLTWRHSLTLGCCVVLGRLTGCCHKQTHTGQPRAPRVYSLTEEARGWKAASRGLKSRCGGPAPTRGFRKESTACFLPVQVARLALCGSRGHGASPATTRPSRSWVDHILPSLGSGGLLWPCFRPA